MLADKLMQGQPVFLHGHLGSGKTELARYISTKKLGKEYHIISGSKHMSPSEIYGHDVLTVHGEEIDKPLDVVAEERLKIWIEDNQERLAGLEEFAREGEINRAQDRILTTLKESSTISKFIPGPIYRAMENGEPFIIDEINAIPHDILIGLNDRLTRKPGDKVNIQQDGGRTITVKQGFCVILTGNLNVGDLQQYVDRKELDPAFVSRLYSEEHDYLPQQTEGKIDEADANEDELFLVATTMLLDRQSNLKIPEGGLEKVWNLTKAAKIIQNVFAKKQVNSKYYYTVGGTNQLVVPTLEKTVLSIRALKKIIESWIADGFNKELDHYVYDEFIKTSTNPSDAAYCYQLLSKFHFFNPESWGVPDYGTGGQLSSFKVKDPENKRTKEIEFIPPREVVDMLYGKERRPERKIWPEYGVLGEKATEEEKRLGVLKEEIDGLNLD